MMRRLVVAGHEPNERNGRALAELDAILVSPSDEQRELSAARLNGQKSRCAAVRPPKQTRRDRKIPRRVQVRDSQSS